MAHTFRQLRLERVIRRVPHIEHSPDRTKVLIYGERRASCVRACDQVPVDIDLRKKISQGGLSGENQIRFIDPERLVHAARSDIGKQGGQIRRQLLLYVEIPLHHVVSFRLRIDEGRTQRVGGE